MFVLEIYIATIIILTVNVTFNSTIESGIEKNRERKKGMLPSQHTPFEVGSHMQDVLRDDNLPFSHTMQGFDSDIFVVISKLQA